MTGGRVPGEVTMISFDDEDTFWDHDEGAPRPAQDEATIAFSIGYKRQIIELIEQSPESMREILEREGLYYADVLRWREEQARGNLRDSQRPPTLEFPHDTGDPKVDAITALERR